MSDLAITAAGRLDQPDPAAQLRTAAAQFEAYFLRQLLAHAGSADFGGVQADSSATKQFREMLHNGLAEEVAGGLGLADIIVRDVVTKHGGKM